MALPPDREAAPPWQVLIGPFAAEHVEAELEHGGPVLLVPNDRERADALAQEFVGRGGGRLYFSRDLLAGEDGELCWYRYSDARFDGVTPPEELHHLAPNLRLRDLDLRPVVRLDSLIHSWANRDSALAAVVSAGGGRVWLQSKQPVPIVAGVSRVVEVIGEFCWTPLGTPVDPPAGPASLERVAHWLESSGFQPAERRPVNAQCSAPSLVWRQDRLQRAASRQRQLEGEIERLREEHAALIEEHGAAQACWQTESQVQRQGAAAAREEAAAERSRLEGDVARLEGELARLQGQVIWLEGEAARWAGEGASLQQELGGARAEGEALRQQIVVLQRGLATQREQLLAEAAQERVAREAEIGRLGLESVVLRQEAEALRQEAAGQQQEVAGQRQALEAARQELEAARQELETLRREKEEQRQALLAEAAAAVAAAELRAEAAVQAAGAAAAEAAAQAAAQAAAERGVLAAEIDRLRQENAHRQQESEALLEGARLEIAAILDLLDPAESLSPDGAAPAAP